MGKSTCIHLEYKSTRPRILPIIGHSNGNLIAPSFYKKLYYYESPELLDEIRDNVQYYSEEEKLTQYKRLRHLMISEEEDHDIEVVLGVVLEDGTPKRCWNCFSKNLREVDKQYMNDKMVEYDVECVDCSYIAGTWVCGDWIGDWQV